MGIGIRQLEFNDVILKTFIQIRLDDRLEHRGTHHLMCMTADKLFLRCATKLQAGPIRHQVAVIAIHHHDHLFKVLHYRLESVESVRS